MHAQAVPKAMICVIPFDKVKKKTHSCTTNKFIYKKNHLVTNQDIFRKD